MDRQRGRKYLNIRFNIICDFREVKICTGQLLYVNIRRLYKTNNYTLFDCVLKLNENCKKGGGIFCTSV